MSLEVNLQNIGTTPSRLGTRGGGRRGLLIRNPPGSGATIQIGDSAVEAAKALYVVAPGDPTLAITAGFAGDPLAGEDWYAETSSGTATGVIVGEL